MAGLLARPQQAEDLSAGDSFCYSGGRNHSPLVTFLREVLKANSKIEAYGATAGLLVFQKASRDRGLWHRVIIVPVGGDGGAPSAGH